jgi:hypothetical protein
MNDPNAAPSPQLLTVTQVAKRWQCDPEKVSRVFGNEPGVLDIGTRGDVRKRKKGYRILRIPLHVLDVVETRLTKK